MSVPAPALHSVWRAHELARSRVAGLDTGHAALNAVLPGGGWPPSGLTELLQPQPGCGEWGLLAPALAGLCGPGRAAAASRAGGTAGALAGVLVGAPYAPFGPALAARGVAPSRLLRVQVQAAAERLWAAEQALRCADVACVLLWLEQAQPAQLRRLHLTAQDHGKPLFVFRPERAQQESSPAPLRLLLHWHGSPGQAPEAVAAPCEAAAAPPQALAAPPDALAAPPLWVQVLKRRGPLLGAPLALTTASPGLAALLAASRAQAQARRRRGPALLWPVGERVHAVDRAASLV